ncbi:MAG: hypothetical protein LW870_21760, partial [Pirellula sp.]|nr:hypothetical protein [Pirellula sp.]
AMMIGNRNEVRESSNLDSEATIIAMEPTNGTRATRVSMRRSFLVSNRCRRSCWDGVDFCLRLNKRWQAPFLKF